LEGNIDWLTKPRFLKESGVLRLGFYADTDEQQALDMSRRIERRQQMKQYGAEFFGTFWLVLGGCGSAVLAAAFPEVGIGLLGVALAFGLTVYSLSDGEMKLLRFFNLREGVRR